MTTTVIHADISGIVAAVFVDREPVNAGTVIGQIECMKSFWDVLAPTSGIVHFLLSIGEAVGQGEPIAEIVEG